jgi:RNA recognition motif-containing protein
MSFTVMTVQVKSIKIVKSKQTGQSEGYGFVEFATRATAEWVLQTYTGQRMPNVTQVYRLDWPASGSGEWRGHAGDNSGCDEYTIFVGGLSAEVTDSTLEVPVAIF